MSDFLTHLAARALVTGERVIPRTQSIFEPSASMPEAWEFSTEAPRAERSPELARPNPLSSPTQSVEESIEAARKDNSRKRERQVPHSGPASQTAIRTIHPRESAPPHQMPASAAGAPAMRVTEQRTVEHLITVREEVEKTAGQKKETSRTAPADSPQRPAGTPVRRTASSITPPLLSRPVSAVQPVPTPARPEPPVTIEVTIGRIEVRAMDAPAPKPRTAPSRPAPALSLEAYLKQRNREKG